MSQEITKQEQDLLTTPRSMAEVTTPRSPNGDAVESDSISAQQLRSIKVLHQKVAERFSNALSNLLQRVVEVRIREVESKSYSQFAFGRTNPTCLITLSAAPLTDPLSIDLSPSFLYPVIDCLLGGGREPVSLPDRPPTEIEKRLAKRITAVLLDEMHEAWEPVLAVELEIQSLNSNAQQVRMVAPSASVITLCFRVRVADQNGEMTLCLPVKAIQKMIAKLSVGESDRDDEEASLDVQAPNESSDSVSVSVVMGTIELEDEIDTLQPAKLIRTNISPDANVSVVVDGEERFAGRPGSLNGKKAVIIERVLPVN